MASAAAAEGLRPDLIPAARLRALRAATGAVLFAFVSTHLLNHALGLVSLEALAGGRTIFLALWRNPVGTLVLYGAFLIHAGLALRSLYRRRSLRMPRWEAAQLILGLAVPPLLWEHMVGTRMAQSMGASDEYPHVLAILWVLQPDAGLRQVATLLIAWLHGCIGLHYWLRLKSWYAPALPWTYGAALLLPILALLGFAAGGREVAALLADESFRAELFAGFPDRQEIGWLTRIYNGGLTVYFALLLGTLAARLVRMAVERRSSVAVSYPDGRRIVIGRGATLLEASRMAGVPHASVCGGRGRCSTCRVRVVRGVDHLSPPSEDELRVLHRIGAAPPGTRLACQARPTGPVEIVPLLPPHAGPGEARGRPAYLHGAEQEIAILFCDLRAFTNLAEHRLPFDLVFLLNRFFRAMGEAVEEAGGRVDKFIGDGVMALFGIGTTPGQGCRNALEAARRMALHLNEINEALSHDLPEPLRIGIGIHVGPAIIGEMGYGRATGLTAIGDAVNTASRLEALTKEFGCQLVVSEAVAELAGIPLDRHPTREVTLRGRREPILLRIVHSATDLPAH